MVGSLIFQTIQMGVIPILLAQLLAQQGVSSFVVGVILAVSWITIFAFGPFVPRLIRVLGDGTAFILAAALTTGALLILLMESNLGVLIAASVLAGGGLIIRWIAADTLVVTMSRPESRGRMIGLHEALMGLGIALGPLVFVIMDLGQAKLFGLGLCGIGLTLLVLSVANHEMRVEQTSANNDKGNHYKLIIIGLMAAFVSGFIENSSIALLPLHYAPYGYALTTSAVFVSGFGLGGTLLQPPLGYLADRKGVKFAQGVCVTATIAACATAAFVTAPAWLVVGIVFLMGGAVGGLNTLAVVEAGTVLNADRIPVAMTAIAMVYTLGSIAGPAVAGALLDTGYRPAMLIGFLVATSLLGLWLLAHKPAKPVTA
ncbi:MFS transporter [Pseudahrensia aquimaris]|uniref:MFS transporter n=1 Tax=Pseudahrensia aquimaris TaxID=744461 RepID=A0ABW3FE55_9HYPH